MVLHKWFRVIVFWTLIANLCAAQAAPGGKRLSIAGISADKGTTYLDNQNLRSASAASGRTRASWSMRSKERKRRFHNVVNTPAHAKFGSLSYTPALRSPLCSFVERFGGELRLDGARYTYQGFNNYYMLQKASMNKTRPQVTEVLNLAQHLGLSVMRMWAFSDGSAQYMPLQPELGQLDSEVFAALDWVVSEAQNRGIRLILTLTNYYPGYGGMQQYVEWSNTSNASTVQQFYQDPSIQAAFKDYVTAIVLRQNTITDTAYRDDPTILAWDLVNEPANPGDETGNVLHEWLDMMSSYVKSIDTNHLIYYGSPAFFGASSPEWQYLNGNYSGEYSPYGAVPWDPACQGEDWVRNVDLPSIDLASFHIYPFFPMSIYEDQVTVQRVQGHLDAARTVNKPLIIDEFNAKRPIVDRNAFLEQLFGLIDVADSPVVGTNIWMLADKMYGDYDQFEIFGSEAGASKELPPGPPLTAGWAAQLARNAIFRGYVAADTCVRARIHKSGSGVTSAASGWDSTLDILSADQKLAGKAGRPRG